MLIVRLIIEHFPLFIFKDIAWLSRQEKRGDAVNNILKEANGGMCLIIVRNISRNEIRLTESELIISNA